MKRKIVRITESQLKTLLEGVINEQSSNQIGKVIPKKLRNNSKYIDAVNLIYQYIHSKLGISRDAVDLVEFTNSKNQTYFALRSYGRPNSNFVDVFSNGKYQMYVNNNKYSFGTVGVGTDSIEFYDDKTQGLVGNIFETSNGVLTMVNQKSGTAGDSSAKVTKQGNQGVIKWQEKLKKDGFYSGIVDGKWGKKTQEAYDAYMARERRIKEKLPDSPQAKVAPIEIPKVNTDLGKMSAPTSPEAIKQAEQDKYFSDPGRQVFVDNINKSLFFRDAERKTLVWRGPAMNQNDLNNLTKYLSSKGYSYTRYRDRRDGEAAYVWKYGR